MIKLRLLVCCLICIYQSFAQDDMNAVKKAFENFERDAQLKYAISSITVAEAETGKIVFEKNGNYGLAPASSMKIITAAAALDLLGSNFRFKTSFKIFTGKDGQQKILVTGSGDPTLGSTRYGATTKEVIADSLRKKLKQKNISSFTGKWYTTASTLSQQIPAEWIWEDIGNYYGASSALLNWNENQYTIWLQPGKREGDPVKILSLEPGIDLAVHSELKTGTAQSGDNAYIFFNPDAKGVTIKGNVPCCRERFSINGAVPSPAEYALSEMAASVGGTRGNGKWVDIEPDGSSALLYDHLSPKLDSIIYWFMRKSINLYGESLLYAVGGHGINSREAGISRLKKFWQQKSIDSNALAIVDGSGLSPANRVTTTAMSGILVYARKQAWFPAYHRAFSESNGMKVKSGTIGGVRAYAGYFEGRNGKHYCFSFIVNNYTGSVTTLSNKMFAVLNTLKK
jgi:D-alanyl-D-alanine carboxypeptidase/D-alanyl-D-alanine-endopeptidase (penicillin-binding protein 4)